MDWILAASAPLVVGAVFFTSGRAQPAIAAYHLLCGAMILRRGRRLRPLWRWEASTARWTIGTCVLALAALLVAPAVVDPSPYRDLFNRILFPGGRSPLLFGLFAAYTLVIHVPLEELFWRAVVTDPDRGSLPSALGGNAVFFGLVHAVPLGLVLGLRGVLFSLPASAAGALWALATIRSRSLWPALVSHWGADGLLLVGMWFFFVR